MQAGLCRTEQEEEAVLLGNACSCLRYTRASSLPVPEA
jgi:hypothetical protein